MRRLYNTIVLAIACLWLLLLMQNRAAATAPPRSEIAGPTTQQLGLPPNPGDPTAPPAGTPGSHDLSGLMTDRLMVGNKRTTIEEDPEAAKRAREVAARDAAAVAKNDILGFSTLELSLAAVAVLAVGAALFFAFRRKE